MSDITKQNQHTLNPQQIADRLKAILDMYNLVQGQVSALRVALAACFSFPHTNAELLPHVHQRLSARLALMKQDRQGLAEVDGFESVLNELLNNNKSVNEPSSAPH